MTVLIRMGESVMCDGCLVWMNKARLSLLRSCINFMLITYQTGSSRGSSFRCLTVCQPGCSPPGYLSSARERFRLKQSSTQLVKQSVGFWVSRFRLGRARLVNTCRRERGWPPGVPCWQSVVTITHRHCVALQSKCTLLQVKVIKYSLSQVFQVNVLVMH